MPAKNVDLVILVDSSESMRPCFSQLREHLKDLLVPLQQANFNVRFGLVAYAAAATRGAPSYDHTFIGGSGPEMIKKLYSHQVSADDFFTRDQTVVARVLSGLEAQGNEDTLLALDIAADFPFGPMDSTRRVIAVFTDEPLEAGVSELEPIAKIPELVQKMMSRKIQLFASAPMSDALEQLGSMDRAEIEAVNGGDGLKSVDFKKLLAQMGKSISVSSLQAGSEKPWKKAIFGQDQWKADRIVTASNRNVILAVGESAKLDTSKPIKNLRVKMTWTKGNTYLDIYAIYRTSTSKQSQSVGYTNRDNGDGIFLSEDPDLSEQEKSFDMTIDALDNFEDILIAANIFADDISTWSDFDGEVVVETDAGERILTRLSTKQSGSWCVIARIDNRQSNAPQVVNLNHVMSSMPTMDNY